MTKNPVFQFLLWSIFLSHPVFAQEAIQIEIDSAPVEVEIPKPQAPEKQPAPQPAPAPQAEKPQAPEKAEEQTADNGGGYGVAIGIGVLVAGVLAAVAGRRRRKWRRELDAATLAAVEARFRVNPLRGSHVTHRDWKRAPPSSRAAVTLR